MSSGVEIHNTAIVSPGAELGDGVSVGPYSVIGPNVKIGARTKVGPHVVIEGHTTLGEENDIFQFASVGSAPQDLKFRNEPSTLIIGKRNKIREFVTLQPGTATGTMTTTIGDENLFMANCHVGHDCRVGNYNVFANSTALAGHVEIGNRAILGGLVGVHQHCRIGDFAILGGGSMVNGDVPPYCIGQGDRAKLRGINRVALERAGFTQAQVREIKLAYRHMFASLGHLEQKLANIPSEWSSLPHLSLFLDFIRSSIRGVCSPARLLSNNE